MQGEMLHTGRNLALGEMPQGEKSQGEMCLRNREAFFLSPVRTMYSEISLSTFLNRQMPL